MTDASGAAVQEETSPSSVLYSEQPAESPIGSEQVATPALPAGAERREAVRKMFRGTVLLALAGQGVTKTRGVDISTGGVCLIVSANLPSNTQCALRFAIPLANGAQHIIETKAKSAFSVFSSTEDGFKVGFQFLGLNNSNKIAIAQFVGS